MAVVDPSEPLPLFDIEPQRKEVPEPAPPCAALCMEVYYRYRKKK